MVSVSASMCFMIRMILYCPPLAPTETAGTSQMHPLPLGNSLPCSSCIEPHCPHSPQCPLLTETRLAILVKAACKIMGVK